MAIISLLIQLIGLGVGIYIVFTGGFLKGLALILVVATLHFTFTFIANTLTGLHQKTMTSSELDGLAHMASLGLANESVPTAWKIIVNLCTVLFWVTAGACIFWFLTNS